MRFLIDSLWEVVIDWFAGLFIEEAKRTPPGPPQSTNGPSL